jgi:hypothetical protein
MKIILFITLIFLSTFASTNFKETRYVSALDFNRELIGKINLKDDILSIVYSKPSKETITYHPNKITILNQDNQTTEYTFEQYPQAQYMGLIIKAIINDNYNSLDNFFKIKNQKSTIMLEAKPIIYDRINFIEITKKQKSVEKIFMDMSNKDTITIEIIN